MQRIINGCLDLVRVMQSDARYVADGDRLVVREDGDIVVNRVLGITDHAMYSLLGGGDLTEKKTTLEKFFADCASDTLHPSVTETTEETPIPKMTETPKVTQKVTPDAMRKMRDELRANFYSLTNMAKKKEVATKPKKVATKSKEVAEKPKEDCAPKTTKLMTLKEFYNLPRVTDLDMLDKEPQVHKHDPGNSNLLIERNLPNKKMDGVVLDIGTG